MKYDIYFHNDFDGRASAAVMLAFLRSRGDDIEHYVRVKYDIIPQWRDEDFFKKHKLFKGKRNPAIIVDFPYHPKAAFWFDHHLEPFRREGWERRFKEDRCHRCDDSYRSACHLVYDSLRNGFRWKPPAYLKELARWLDVIDGANYRSAKQTIEMKEPAIQLNNVIEEGSDDRALTLKTVRALSERSLSDFARSRQFKKTIAKFRRQMAGALTFYKKRIRFIGKVMVADLAGFPYHELAHYAPYYLYPKNVYAVRYHPYPDRHSLFHVNVAANPWCRRENHKHIGKILKKFGGGGHKDVGGFEIVGRAKVLNAVERVAKLLSH